MRRTLHIILLLTTMLVAANAGELSRQAKDRYTYFFQGAISKFCMEDYQAAYDLLQHCREIDPEAAETYLYLADCYKRMGNDSLHVQMLVKAAELRPDNILYKEQLIPVYLGKEEIDKAAEVMEELVAATPERTEILQVLGRIYEYQQKDDKLLDVLNRLEVQDGQSEELTMSKVQVYSRTGEDKRAYSELKSLCDNHPLDLNYRVMLANWLYGKERKKEALAELRAVIDEDPDNEDAQLSLIDYYKSEKQTALADQIRDNMVFNPKSSISAVLSILKNYIIEKNQESADSIEVMKYIDRVIEQHNDVSVLELKLAYATLKDMPKDEIKGILDQIVKQWPDNKQARYQLLALAYEDSDYNEMANQAKLALEYNPEEYSFAYQLGYAYMMLDRKEESMLALENAAKNVNLSEDKELAEQIYELLGEIYHDLGRNDDAFNAFDKCITINPDNISCLNNFAYYLAQEGKDLDRAAAMSLKTVVAEPNNSTYLDTYAWVLYIQERYEEAKIYMDMAIEKLEEDADKTVYIEHLDAINAKLNK